MSNRYFNIPRGITVGNVTIDGTTGNITTTGTVAGVDINELSVKVVSIDTKLSNAISTVNSDLRSAINAVSNQVSVTSADLASAKSNLLSNINVVSNALSVELVNRASADNALSVRIDSRSQNVSVTSADLASAKSNLLSNVNVVSNALSNEVSNRQSASAALESHVNTLSNAVSVVSAAQLSAWNAISNEISVRTAASAALESHINAVSIAVGLGGGGSSDSNIQNLIYASLGTSQTVIDSEPISTVRTVQYLATAKDNVNNTYKSSRITVLHDGSTAYRTEYDTVYTNSSVEVATFTADVYSGNVRLLAQGDSANVTIQLQKITLGSATVAGNVAGISANLRLSSLSDVDLVTTAPSNGQVLAYSTSSSKWAPSSVGSGGAGSKYDNQYLLTGVTTDATETEIFIDGGSSRVAVTLGKTVYYTVDIALRRTDIPSGHGAFRLQGVANNYSNTVTDIGNLSEVVIYRSDGNYLVDARADDTNNSINIYVVGVAGQTLSWRAVITMLEV